MSDERELVKIFIAATSIGVSQKTIYNWIADGKLTTPTPGYVYLEEAHLVWVEQQDLRKIHSYFMVVDGLFRGSDGKFKSKKAE
jgi:predicted DNA-binding transcriptional regulator AlpA